MRLSKHSRSRRPTANFPKGYQLKQSIVEEREGYEESSPPNPDGSGTSGNDKGENNLKPWSKLSPNEESDVKNEGGLTPVQEMKFHGQL